MARESINIKGGFDLKGFRTSGQNLERTLKKTSRNLERIGTKFSKALTLPLLGLGALAVKSAADFETLKTSLTTALGGSAQAAEAAFKQIEKFASSTPFQLQEVTQAFITLKNMGLDPSIEALEAYGNTASSMGKSLNQMIEAVADAAVGEFERLKEFGIKARSEGEKVSFTFKGVTTTIGKNAQEIEAFLQNIGKTEFAGGIEAQSKTFNGVISTLKDNMALAAASFGELMLPVLKKLSGALQRFAVAVRGINPQMKKWIIVIGAVVAAIGPLLLGLALVTAAIATLSTVSLPLILTIGAIVASIAALSAGFLLVKENLGAFTDFFFNVWVNVKNFFIDSIQSMLTGLNSFLAAFNVNIGQGVIDSLDNLKVTTRENAKEFVGLKQAFKNTFFASEKTKDGVDGLSGAFDGLNVSSTGAVSGLDKVKKAIIGISTKLTGLTGTGVETLSDSLERQFKAGIDKILDIKVDLTENFKLPDFGDLLDTVSAQIDEAAEEAKFKATVIGQGIAEALNAGLQSLAAQTASLVGEFLGNALAGSDVTLEDFGRGFLATVGNFMTQFGQAMIAIGIAESAIAAAISAGPAGAGLAIAGGIALVAAGAALSSISKKGLQTQGGGGAVSTARPSAGFGTRGGIETSELIIDGRKLIIIQQREKGFRR